MLEVNNITLKFGGLIAVNNVSLKCEKNKVTALIGPNGAGKTTLFNCISGVYFPDQGEVLLEGPHLEKKRCFQRCDAGISRTYQVVNLFWSMTVLENVMVGMNCRLKSSLLDALFMTKKMKEEEKSAFERAHEILRFVELDSYADYPARSLPYGKQRLLEIARGLASSPKILLLDEPAAGMNTKEKSELDAILKRIINLGVTILIVEHDMSLIMHVSDYIYVLSDGKLLAQGTPIEIQNNPDVIATYLGGDD